MGSFIFSGTNDKISFRNGLWNSNAKGFARSIVKMPVMAVAAITNNDFFVLLKAPHRQLRIISMIIISVM